MKRVIFLLTMSCILTMAIGCKDDEGGPTCTQEQFLGTYAGSTNCEGVGGIEANEIVITAGGTSNTIIVNNGTTTNEATINGCGFSWGSTALGTGLTGAGTLDGDNLTYTIKLEQLGNATYECVFTGAK